MSALITSVEKVRAAATPEGWLLFCLEQDIDPENPHEPEEGVMINSFDLLRYGMDADHASLKADVAEIVGPRM